MEMQNAFHYAILLLLASILRYVHCTTSAFASDLIPTPFHDGKYVVLLLHRLGLANRLRSMADWHHIALLSGRTLVVSWAETTDCNVKFSDLFDKIPNTARVLSFNVPNGDEGIRYIELIASHYNLSSMPIYEKDEFKLWSEKHKTFFLSGDIVQSDYDLIITSYDGIISLENVQCQQYVIHHSRFLQSLVPNSEAAKLVREIKSQYFHDKIMIGIHYRFHDNLQDWEVVPPLFGGGEAMRFGDGAGLHQFILSMEIIKSKFSYYYDSVVESGIRFFVASNDGTSKDLLLAAFPDAVCLRGEYDRRSPHGMQFALVEWLLLAESDMILNTYGSSFAVEAAQVHMTPIVSVWHDRLIHHSNVHLPYCGHMQFARAFGLDNIATSYTEGTTDRRTVESIAVRLSPCESMRGWGLEDVLCVDSNLIT